ncbi:MAG: TolC family protein [Candidatus Ozemobacteraceae bacterium]
MLLDFSCRLPRLFSGISVLVLLVAAPGLLGAQTASETWSLEKLLAWGLKNHPQLQQTDGAVQSAKARIGQTQSSLSPKLAASAGYSRRRQEFSSAWNSGLPHDDLSDSTNNSLSLQKVVYDSGRTRDLVQAGQASWKASLQDRNALCIQIAGSIKSAFFQVLQAKAMIKVQSDALEGFKTHLHKTRGFVEVGTRPPFDITKAEVDVANAQVSLIKAESAYRNTLAQLSRTAGLEESIVVEGAASQSQPIQPLLDQAQLHEDIQKRPDIEAAKFRLNSASHQLREVKKGKAPTLSSSASYGWQGTVTPLDRSWAVGLSLNVPILDGKLTNFQKQDAEGSLQAAQGRLASLRVDVRAALETAITGVTDAFKRLEASQVLLRQASESLTLAEGRFDSGLGSPIEITDARTQYSNAQGTLVTTFYDALIALTQLDSALGKFPEEYIRK